MNKQQPDDGPSQPLPVVITIDGPAGAGKSTVAQRLAEKLGFEFLDTGAMYRCVTLAVQEAGIAPTDLRAVAELAQELQITLDGERVQLGGVDVADRIRTPQIAQQIGVIADNPLVRSILTQWQRRWATGRNVVTEGRDQGSEVFTNSPCKVFLSASPEERAKRRMVELHRRGIDMDYDAVLQQQTQRDQDDYARPVGALRKAPDAIEICTDGLSLDAVVEKLLVVARSRIAELNAGESIRSTDTAARCSDGRQR